MTILDEIFKAKRRRVREARQVMGRAELTSPAGTNTQPRALRTALSKGGGPRLIAEFKRASPSKGVINDSIDPAEAATAYERGGASAISVITEEDFFKGSLDDLTAIRKAVSLPLLRKDFIFDAYQLHEAAAAGADAILLIVAALEPSELERLRMIAEEELGMDALVEVHTIEEMNIARSSGATLIGVNNRDLRSFEVSLDTSRKLIEHAPPDAQLVAESGIESRRDIEELHALGYAGFLVGETLMRSNDPEGMLRELLAEERGE